MSRSVVSRLMAVLAACLLGFSSMGVAVAHAVVHAHVAADHRDIAPFAVPTVEDGEHGHDHAHVVVGKAPTPRDGARLAVATPFDTVILARHQQPPARAPRPSRPPSLLPRPGPERGPPSGPRAPPTT